MSGRMASDCAGASFLAAIDRVQEELKELGLWKFAGGIMYIMQEGVRHACFSAYRSSE